jgi:hypothetical protein
MHGQFSSARTTDNCGDVTAKGCIDRSTQLRGGLRIALYLRHSACVRDTCGGLT